MKNRRFEIPIDPSAYNLFAIDDYLRSIRTPEDRKKLIREVGLSAQARAAFERRSGLPRGAVELAMMTEDKRVQAMSEKLAQRLGDSAGKPMSPQDARKFYLEVDSIMSGLRTLYPEAIHFLKEYSALAQRNKTTFYGDYQFSNDYRIMLANTCPGPNPPDWCSPTPWFCTQDYILTTYYAVWWIAGAVWYVAAFLVAALVLFFFCVTPPAQIPC